MIKNFTKFRIAKHFLLLNFILLTLSLCIVNISFAVEDFPWEIFYPAFINKSIDKDKDGYTKEQGDCNDLNPAINPDATEICGDGIDQDCNGSDLSCNGGGGDISFNATGTWSIKETTTYDNLDAGYLGQVKRETYIITQTGAIFSMITIEHGSMDDGTVSGSEYTFTFSYYNKKYRADVTVEGVFTLTSETTLEGTYTLEADAGTYIHILERSIVGTKN